MKGRQSTDVELSLLGKRKRLRLAGAGAGAALATVDTLSRRERAWPRAGPDFPLQDGVRACFPGRAVVQENGSPVSLWRQSTVGPTLHLWGSEEARCCLFGIPDAER